MFFLKMWTSKPVVVLVNLRFVLFLRGYCLSSFDYSYEVFAHDKGASNPSLSGIRVSGTLSVLFVDTGRLAVVRFISILFADVGIRDWVSKHSPDSPIIPFSVTFEKKLKDSALALSSTTSVSPSPSASPDQPVWTVVSYIYSKLNFFTR